MSATSAAGAAPNATAAVPNSSSGGNNNHSPRAAVSGSGDNNNGKPAFVERRRNLAQSPTSDKTQHSSKPESQKKVRMASEPVKETAASGKRGNRRRRGQSESVSSQSPSPKQLSPSSPVGLMAAASAAKGAHKPKTAAPASASFPVIAAPRRGSDADGSDAEERVPLTRAGAGDDVGIINELIEDLSKLPESTGGASAFASSAAHCSGVGVHRMANSIGKEPSFHPSVSMSMSTRGEDGAASARPQRGGDKGTGGSSKRHSFMSTSSGGGGNKNGEPLGEPPILPLEQVKAALGHLTTV